MSGFGSFLGAFGGAAVGSAVVKLVLDTQEYQAELTKAEGQTGTAVSGMGQKTTQFGTYAKAAFLVAAAAAAEFSREAIQAASEHEQVMTRLTLAVGDNTKAFEDQASALQVSTGFTQDAILSIDEILARFQLTSDEIRRLTPLILDYAVTTGTDATTAATSLSKALLGSSRALKTVGIDFTDTGTVLGNYQELVDKLSASTVKGSSTADTYARSQRQLSATITEAKVKLGEAFLPELKAANYALSKTPPTLIAVVAGLLQLGAVAGGAAQSLVAMRSLLKGSQFAEFAGGITDVATSAAGLTVAGAALIPILGYLGVEALNSATGAQTLEEKQAGLRDELDAGTISTRDYVAQMRGTVPPLKAATSLTQTAADAIRTAKEATVEHTDAIDKDTVANQRAADRIRELANEVDAANKHFTKWAKGVKADAESEIKSLGGVDVATRKTTNEFFQGAQRMARAGKQAAAAMRELSKDSTVPQAFKEWLVSQGPAAVANFAQLSGKRQNEVVGDWKKTQGAAEDYGRFVSRLNPTVKTDTSLARANLLKVAAIVQTLQQNSSIQIDVHTTYSSSGRKPPGVATGGVIRGATGFVTGGPTYLTGEGSYPTPFGPGAELVQPLNDTMMRRLGEAIGKHVGRGTTAVFNGTVITHDSREFAEMVGPALDRYFSRRASA